MRFVQLCGLAVLLLIAAALPRTAEAACLSKPATDRAGRAVKQHVIAPMSEVARYQTFGYVLEPCDVPLEQLRQSVANVCRMAASAPVRMQAHVARSNGASITDLCTSGRAGLAEMQAGEKP
jgi:hypothetical protein